MGGARVAPPAGLEPTHPAPEAGALSTELRGRAHKNYNIVLLWEQARALFSAGPCHSRFVVSP